MPGDTHRGLGSASVPRARLPVQGTVRRCCSVLSTSCLLERANGDELTRGRDLGRGHQQASRTFQVQRGCPVYVDEESACWSLGAPHAGSCPRPPPASPIAGIKPFLCARPRGRRAAGQPERAACECRPLVGPASEALSAELCTPAGAQPWALRRWHLGSWLPAVLKGQLPEWPLHLCVPRRARLSRLRRTTHVA